jgi:hypothetical protein
MMKLELSDASVKFMHDLCDLALKQGGLQSRVPVNAFLDEFLPQVAKAVKAREAESAAEKGDAEGRGTGTASDPFKVKAKGKGKLAAVPPAAPSVT